MFYWPLVAKNRLLQLNKSGWDEGWLLVSTYLVPLYGVEEVQVSLVRYPSMNDQDLSINDCCDGQKAKNILKQLQDLIAMSLSVRHSKKGI